MVLLKLVARSNSEWSYHELATELGLSPSEVHAALRRAAAVNLYNPDEKRPIRKALCEFVTHGLKYVYPVERGPITIGAATAHGAPPLNEFFHDDELPPVWPDPNGTVRGETFQPLYPSAIKAIESDAKLYELLALVDAIRGGRARERQRAEKLFAERLGL